MILKDSMPQKVTNLDNAFYIKRQPNYWYKGQSKEDYNYINYVGNITSSGVTEGFDMNYYDQLKADYMLYSELNSFIHGRLFISSYNISNISLTNINNKIFNNINADNEISRFIQFPQATGNITYFFDFTNTDNNLKSSQIPSASRQWYINAGIIIND